MSSRSKFGIEPGGRLHGSDAIPKPAPLPARRFGKGDLELGLGYTFVRFRSSLFRANTSGLRSSFAYSVSDWMAIECSGTSAFGSQSSGSTLAKYVFYGAGIRIETPDPKISAWVHAVFGGIHMFPQTVNSNGGIASEFGIGSDIRLKPLLYIRVQANYLRSRIYSQGQNNFNVGIGLVYRFSVPPLV